MVRLSRSLSSARKRDLWQTAWITRHHAIHAFCLSAQGELPDVRSMDSVIESNPLLCCPSDLLHLLWRWPLVAHTGLHVQEMMHTLPQQLAALAAQQHESASVIVGVGRHTKGPPTARMGPAVEALLKDKGYSYKQPQPGLLRVRLR